MNIFVGNLSPYKTDDWESEHPAGSGKLLPFSAADQTREESRDESGQNEDANHPHEGNGLLKSEESDDDRLSVLKHENNDQAEDGQNGENLDSEHHVPSFDGTCN
jgi:hypothetical protein